MTDHQQPNFLKTGVPNLDGLLGGGFPRRLVSLIGGSPGAGKTILSQQICFHNASPDKKVLFFQTLSEPTIKTLGYLKAFSFFDVEQMDKSVVFYDLGVIMRTNGLEKAAALVMEQIKKVKPAIVVIDSFKVFDDLKESREQLRKFTYEVAINLMAWECTAFLLGEFTKEELAVNPISSIVDGVLLMESVDRPYDSIRTLQIVKMRGANHNRARQPFEISEEGITIFSPSLTLRRTGETKVQPRTLRKTGIAGLDSLLGKGVPSASLISIAGTSGTGKTLLALELLYRGTRDFDEPGLFVSFGETREQLISAAISVGWDLEKELKRGLLELLIIPQPEILIEKHLLFIEGVIQKKQVRRVVVDSLSAFLHKVRDSEVARASVFQLGAAIQNAGALGFMTIDIPFESNQIGRFGVEETTVDGIILLTTQLHGTERERFIEIYKMRNTSHLSGTHPMQISHGGIVVGKRKGSKK